MRRAFAGLWAPDGPPAAAERRLAGVLDDEGESHLLERGALRLAYSGPRLEAPEGAPACVLDGSLYEGGQDLPGALTRDPATALGRLRGDFALVAVDGEGRSAVVARDHMGGRLAVWSEREGVVAFATETRLLLRLLERRPEPDRTALAHWLAISGIPGDRTLYAGVRRLESGSMLALNAGAEPRRFWDPSYSEPMAVDVDESVELLRGALRTAVHRRCEPGGRTAVMLSGGLDSGSVAALAASEPRELAPRRAYSAVFPRHETVDETAEINLVAGRLGLESTRVVVRSGSVIAGTLPYLRHWQLPPVSPNLFFWNPLLRRAAEAGVEVMLDGEGGDELFGFSVYLLADRVRAARLVSALQLIYRVPGRPGQRPPLKSVLKFVRAYALKGAVPPGLHQAVRRTRGAARYTPPWLRPELAEAYFESDELHAWKDRPGPRWFAWLVSQTTRGMGPSLAYDHVRRRAALAGIEARHPLVDVDVLELMFRLPPEHAYSSAHSRPLLRKALAGLLPDEVRLRSTKSNFDAVFHESLAGPDLPALRALLGAGDLRLGDYVRREAVQELLERPPSRGPDLTEWAMRVWRLATAELWLRVQDDSDALDRLLGPLLAAPDATVEG